MNVMEHNNNIGLIGNGGHADEAESYSRKPVGFRAVDKPYMNDRAEVDVTDPGENVNTAVHIAIGAPAVRKEMELKWPGESYESIISEHAIIDETAEIGEGSLVAPRVVITTNVKIGRHVVLNVAATVQHNSEVGDFTTIGPGAHIGGNVKIGEGVFIGIGANISNAVRIANGVVIGAGATVIKDADVENGVYVGTPAQLIKQNEGWLREI